MNDGKAPRSFRAWSITFPAGSQWHGADVPSAASISLVRLQRLSGSLLGLDGTGGNAPEILTSNDVQANVIRLVGIAGRVIRVCAAMRPPINRYYKGVPCGVKPAR
jgi:hypothetical protein